MTILLQAGDWSLFFGHFHPLVVHLPIGILILALLLDVLCRRPTFKPYQGILPVVLLAGFFSAMLSCVLGWMLSFEGGYNEDTLFWHQWLGIGTALMAGVSWWLKKKEVAGRLSPTASKFYIATQIGMMTLLMLAGHLGGTMTHGEDYLTKHAPEPLQKWMGVTSTAASTKREPITDLQEALVYKQMIEPVLEQKCWSCHGANRSKGNLRMDTEALLMKGGKHGLVIKTGNAKASELMIRVSLPVKDEKRMPPKGKPGLTADEIDLIRQWIDKGASFTQKMKEIEQDKMPVLAAPNELEHEAAKPSPVYETTVEAAAKTDIDQIIQAGLLVSPVAQNKTLLDISAINNPDLSDSDLKVISKVANQVVWLKLSQTKVTDNGIKSLATCKNLVKFDLNGLPISSKSVSVLKGFINLEYLNLNNTNITDSDLLELSTLKAIKNIYCWNTKVTARGVEAALKRNPGVRVFMGSVPADR